MSENGQTRKKRTLPVKVGLTGGIGSGKTLVCQLFESLGIPIYNADASAKRLMVESQPLVASIKKLFGEAAYHEDGSLNRKHIAALAFSDRGLLEQLNALVHPAVLKDGEDWHLRQTQVPYTIKESALLFEIGSEQLFDKTILVTAPEEIRTQRVVRRDGVDAAAVRARMDKQWPDDKKLQLADFVIVNDGKHLLIPQVLAIHESLLSWLNSSNPETD